MAGPGTASALRNAPDAVVDWKVVVRHMALSRSLRAGGGELTPEDMRGGTFAVSNHGVSGSLFASPISSISRDPPSSASESSRRG